MPTIDAVPGRTPRGVRGLKYLAETSRKVITLGILMMRGSKGRKQYLLYGIMAVTLGCGDAFHLVPRPVALCTTGLDHYTAALGIGKLVTSITMTVFYVLLYCVWRCRYQVSGRKGTTVAV